MQLFRQSYDSFGWNLVKLFSLSVKDLDLKDMMVFVTIKSTLSSLIGNMEWDKFLFTQP